MAGGKREGAGRPLRGDEPMRRVSVWLTDTHLAALREIGGENVGAGIRRIIDERRQHAPRQGQESVTALSR